MGVTEFIFNLLFSSNLMIFIFALIYTLYIDHTFVSKKREIPYSYKVVLLLLSLILILKYLFDFYRIIKETANTKIIKNKKTLSTWIIQMFIDNLLAFSLLYFALSLLYPDQFLETGKDNDERSLLDRIISMIYFSASTFFTIGFGDVIALKNLSRIFNVIQIMTAYIVQTYLYADILLGN